MPVSFVNLLKRIAGGAAASRIGLGTSEPRGIPERPFIASAHGSNQNPAKPSGLL
jgi:hypothetical protein